MILLWILVLIIVYIKMINPGKKRKHPVLNVKYYAHRGFHGEEGIPENSIVENLYPIALISSKTSAVFVAP